MLTTQKITTGVFEVLWNGEKTPYQIINGSAGFTGRNTRNTYGIIGNGKTIWIGSLASSKKTVGVWLSKK